MCVRSAACSEETFYFVFLARFQKQTHSSHLSPLPSSILKAQPPPTLHFLSFSCPPSTMWASLVLYHRIFQLSTFFLLTFNSDNLCLYQLSLLPSSPWFLVSPFYTSQIASFAVGSRTHAARLCQCQLFANLPGHVCESGGKSLRQRPGWLLEAQKPSCCCWVRWGFEKITVQPLQKQKRNSAKVKLKQNLSLFLWHKLHSKTKLWLFRMIHCI